MRSSRTDKVEWVIYLLVAAALAVGLLLYAADSRAEQTPPPAPVEKSPECKECRDHALAYGLSAQRKCKGPGVKPSQVGRLNDCRRMAMEATVEYLMAHCKEPCRDAFAR